MGFWSRHWEHKDSPSVEELVGRIESEYKTAFEDFKAKIVG